MRQKSPLLTYEHMKLCDQIKFLREQNQKLKKRLQKMQDAMHLVYTSKKKYKIKFKEVKQKLDILQTVYQKNTRKNTGIYLSQYYDGFQQNRLSSQQAHNNFFRVNKVTHDSKQNTKSSHSKLKQDQTSNTLQTMPSLRKSNSKQLSENRFFRGKVSIENQQSNTKRNSMIKDIGKIFKFKDTKQSNFKYHSSGSECENDFLTNRQQRQTYERENQIEYQGKNEAFFRYPNQIRNQQVNQGKGLKELMQNLILEFKSFDMSNKTYRSNRSQNQQKILHQFPSAQNLFNKIQQVSQKLNQIESNQSELMVRIQRHEQKLVQSTKNLGKKNQNSNSRMNSSFLKAIEDIGKDLTDWKINY